MRGICKKAAWILAMCLALGCCVSAVKMPLREPATEEKPVLTLWASGSEEDYGAVVRAMQEQHGICVEFAPFTEEGEREMLQALAAGRPTYDLVQIEFSFGYPYSAEDLVKIGAFQPLEAQVVRKAVGSMWPALQELAVRDGEVCLLPVSARPYVLHTWDELIVADWDELVQREGFLGRDELLWACLLEQYMLDYGQEGFCFDCDAFLRTLELAKRAYRTEREYGQGVDIPYVELGCTAQIARVSLTAYQTRSARLGWLPSMDGKWRIPMKVSALAIPSGAPHAEEAQTFLAELAAVGLYGDPESMAQGRPYGGYDTQSCYDEPAHIACTVGSDEHDIERWRQIMENACVTPRTELLTACWLEDIQPYFAGEITAQQCARRMQQKLEQQGQ